MPADGRAQRRDPLGQLDARFVIGRVVADVDHPGDPGVGGLPQRGVRRVWRPKGQQVRVRVDQLDEVDELASSFSIRGNRTPPSVVCVRTAVPPHSWAVTQGILKSALTCAAIFCAVSGIKGAIRRLVSRIASARLYITVCSRLRWSDCLASTQGALSSMSLLPRLTAAQVNSRAPVYLRSLTLFPSPLTALGNYLQGFE